MAEEKISFDRIMKEIIEVYPAENIIRFINTVYNEKIPLDSEVTRLATDSNYNKKLRCSDVMLKVNERVYHAEIQSDDRTMVFRMFEYGFRSAVIHGKTVTKDTLTLKFPTPVVIHLRKTPNTPKELKIRLELPNIEPVEYMFPTKYVGDYDCDTMADGSLYAMFPFYSMKLENNLTAEEEKQCFEEIISLVERLMQDMEKGKISKTVSDLVICGIADVLSNIKSKTKIKIHNREELDKVMDNVMERKYYFKQLELFYEGVQEGMEKGRQEGIQETIERFRRGGMSDEEINKYLH
ncbi:MAG: hypothetical protein FWH05_00685 [Oscillospiraceae bacterium]|nr:hypothetical protein [Oscillospiraceae bacterium]